MFKVAWDSFEYPSKQFGIWRIAFGSFLTYYYIRLFPYAAELYSRSGSLPNGSVAGFQGTNFYPSFLLALDTPLTAQIIVGLCVVFSALITAGFFRRSAALLLWVLVTWLYNRNTLTNSPDYSFVNWLIFILAIIPTGEDYAVISKSGKWKMPKAVYWSAWVVLAFGYMVAGNTKIKYMGTSWRDGSALYYVLTTDNTRREWFGTLFNNVPQFLFWPLTWGTLVLESGAPFFVVFKRARMWWWTGMILMHLGILLVINLPEVSIGMILFHLFLWDLEWLRYFRRMYKDLRYRLKPSTVHS